MDVAKNMLGSYVLTGMSVQSYFRYICVANMIERHESFLAPVEILNGKDSRSKSLGVSYYDNALLYKATTGSC